MKPIIKRDFETDLAMALASGNMVAYARIKREQQEMHKGREVNDRDLLAQLGPRDNGVQRQRR